MIGISTLHFAIRLLLAIAMGATVGLERQWRQRMAGTRTNALVAAGAAAFVMCGLLLDNDHPREAESSPMLCQASGFSAQASSSRMARTCADSSSPNREHLNAHSPASRNGLPYRCLSFEDRLSSDKTLPRYSVRAFLYSAMIRGFSLGPASA